MKAGFRLTGPDPAGPPQVLVVCDGTAPPCEGAPPDWLHFVTFADLSARSLNQSGAQLVLSPLLGRGFDAMDVADRLSALGFAGRYRAVAACLPAPDTIIAEILAACPQLDFRIVMLTGYPGVGQIVEFGDQD